MANREFGGKIRSKRSHTLSKPYERRKSFLNKFTDTVKDILVPSWLSDFMRGKSSTENSQNNLVEEQNGNEVEENEENDNYLTPQDSPTIAERRPAQPRPLHPEFSSYHQPQTKSITRRPNLPNFGNDHLLPSHKVQYQPDPRFSTPTNPSISNDVLLQHTENSEAFSTPLLEKRPYMHLSEADIDQLRNRLHQGNNTDATTSTLLQQQATDDNELDEEEASGSVSMEPEDVPDLDRPEAWNSNYLRGRTNNQSTRGRRPSFEPSLFGSPFMKSSLLSDSFHESPFYAGKTRYGGAAANRKLRLKMSNPYSAAMPYRKQVNAKPLKSSSSAVTSSTAKRILDTLEMMATPLSDAHRMPVANNSFTDSVLQFTPSTLKRRNRPTIAASMFSTNSQKLPSRGPPTVMSNSPSIAAIARNRHSLQKSFQSEPKKLPEKIVETVKEQKKSDKPVKKPIEVEIQKSKTIEPVVRDITPEREAVREPTPEKTISFESTPIPKPMFSPAPPEKVVESPSIFGSSTGGKMKRDKSYNLRPGSKGIDNEEDEEPPVQLETNFILPVKEMPKFSFGANLAVTTKTPETPPLTRPPLSSSSITSTPVASAASLSLPEPFTFSSPISSKVPTVSQNTASSLDFKFSSPAKVKEPDSPAQTFQFASSSTKPKPKFSPISTGISVAPQLKSGSVLEALSGGKTSSSPSSDNNFSSGFLTAKTLKTSGSVMDILGDAKKSSLPEKKSTASLDSSPGGSVFGGLQPATTLKTGSVMDILGKKTGDDVKQAEEKELETAADDTKEKPEEKVEDGSEEEEDEEEEDDDEDDDDDDDSVSKNQMGESDEKCARCLNRCGPDQTLCMVCKTQNQTNTDENSTPKPPAPNEPDPFMAKFTKPTGTWECDTCMIQNKPDATKCVACETPKPSSTPMPPKSSSLVSKPDELMSKFLKPAGAWECDTCMVQNKADSLKCCACETPKPGQTCVPLSNAAAAVCQKVDPLMAKFLKPADAWECGVCLIQNKSSDKKCVVCQSPNPDAPSEPTDAVARSQSSSSSSSQIVTSEPLASAGGLDKPIKIWKCDTCLVSNPIQIQKCIACDTPRIKPAVRATIAAISSGSADVLPKFGAGVTSTPTFKFGSSSDSASNTASSGGFKFGISTTTTTAETKEKFKFGTTTTTAPSSETSTNNFVFGQPAPVSTSTTGADDTKKTSEGSGFKFGSSSTSSASANVSSPFSFVPDSSKNTTVEEKTTKESGFVFSQSPSSSFTFSGNTQEKAPETSVTPLFGTPGLLASPGLNPFANTKPDTEVNKPCAIVSSVTPSSQGFSFSSAASTTASSSIFTVSETTNTGAASLAPVSSPFGAQIETPAPQASKPLFGFAANTETNRSAEVPAPQPFAFGAPSEPNKSANLSENKNTFATNSLKRDRNDECDGPSDAKRSFGSSTGTTQGGFGGFNFAGSSSTKSNTNSGFNNSFNPAPSAQFAFSPTSNSTSTFGSGSTSTPAVTTAAACASFGSPSFNFATAASPAVSSPKDIAAPSNASQPFVFGSNPTPFSGGSASKNTFGNKGSVFGSTGSTSASLFENKSVANKPFGAPSPAAPSSAGSTPTPFMFGNNNLSFNFSSGSAQGGIYQFSGKQNDSSVSTNSNIYQFGQTPSTNNAPLGANTSAVTPSSGINFNPTPSFNFAAGTGGEFNFGVANENTTNASNPTRRIKKAVRRTKN